MRGKDKLLETCYEEACTLREELHRFPELGHREYRTSESIKKALRSYGVEILKFGLNTGVVGLLRGKYPGKLLALREDIDALPMEEKSGLSFSSCVAGVSHSCGHDIHTAALLGCAKYLTARREELHGSVLFVFQCAEEVFDGAVTMLERGIFRERVPDALLGFHCAPDIALGKIGIVPGISNASCDEITVRVIGKGGHGAHPYRCIDPVVIAAGLLTQLQTIVSRNNKPVNPVVLTFGEFHGGTAPNIIPEEVVMRGTMRTFSNEVRLQHLALLRQICTSFCAAFGAKCEVRVEKGMPPLVNAEDICRALAASSAKVLGEDCVVTGREASMGSDDFSCLLEACGNRGVQYLLGTAAEEYPNSALGLHVAENVFPSQALRPAIATLAQFSLDYLKTS